MYLGQLGEFCKVFGLYEKENGVNDLVRKMVESKILSYSKIKKNNMKIVVMEAIAFTQIEKETRQKPEVKDNGIFLHTRRVALIYEKAERMSDGSLDMFLEKMERIKSTLIMAQSAKAALEYYDNLEQTDAVFNARKYMNWQNETSKRHLQEAHAKYDKKKKEIKNEVLFKIDNEVNVIDAMRKYLYFNQNSEEADFYKLIPDGVAYTRRKLILDLFYAKALHNQIFGESYQFNFYIYAPNEGRLGHIEDIIADAKLAHEKDKDILMLLNTSSVRSMNLNKYFVQTGSKVE